MRHALLLAALVLAALTGYLLILSVAAVLRRRVEELSYAEAPVRRFAILIPAHNEAALIGRLLESLRALDYPRELVEICVVADNCTAKEIILTSGKLPTPEPLRNTGGAGVTGSCKLDNRNANGVISVDLDAKVNGKAGEVTIKGHLDIVCRDGL